MEHLFFIASCAVCICFNQIFYIGRRNLTLLLTLHSPLKRTYSLIFLLLLPNTSVHGLYLESLSMDKNPLILSQGRSGVKHSLSQGRLCKNSALNYYFGVSPESVVDFTFSFFTVIVLSVMWNGNGNADVPCVVAGNQLKESAAYTG